MPVLKLLNKLLLVENVLGIYRNYCNQKKIKKCVIIFLTVIKSFFHTVLLIKQAYFLISSGDYTVPINLTISTFGIAIYLVMDGIVHSRAFQSYMRSISRVSDTFKDDQILINSLKKVYWLSVILLLFIIILCAFRSVLALTLYTHSNRVIEGLMTISHSVLRITILFYYLMFFVVIIMVFHLTKCLTLLVSATQKRVGRCGIGSDEYFGITTEQIKGWAELYRDLSNCCDKLMLCFGRQFFFSLLTSATYYVLWIYQTCYMNAYHVAGSNIFYSTVILMSYGSMMIMPIIAGQKARNQGLKLRQALVRLYNTIIIDPNETNKKLIKDFIRTMKKNPIDIKLLSKMSAGTYMLPVIITLGVNYLIVMMQFTHIV